MAKQRKNGNGKDDKHKKGKDKGPAPEAFELSPETRRGLFTIFLLILALLFTLAAFGQGGVVGGWLDAFGRKLLGRLSPLLPAFLLFVAIGRLRRESKAFDAAAKLGAAPSAGGSSNRRSG